MKINIYFHQILIPCEIEDLEFLIIFQCNLFIKDILNDDDENNKILDNPDYILELADKYYDNYVFITLIKICYVVSLIHNNYPNLIAQTLVHCIPLNLYIKDNTIFLVYPKRCKKFNYDIELFITLSKTKVVGKYLSIK